MAQQGSPPRRSSRRPESGRAGRHGSREQPTSPGPDPRDDWGSRPERDDWPSRPERADVGRRGAPAQRGSRPARADREEWRQHDPFTADDEADAPPWAGPSIHATRAGGSRVRPPAQGPAEPEPRPGGGRRRGRADATRLRRSQRRVYLWCGTAIAVAVIVAVVAAIYGLRKPAPASPFVTTLQAGEYRTVPSACGSVSPALLSQYLPGARRVTPAGSGTGTSQCTFTVDSKPMFRVLQVTAQAYQPSAVAAGNGSATANATGARRVTPAGSGTGTSQCTFTVDSKPMFRVLQVTAQAYQPSAVAAGNGSATANATGAFLLAQQQLAHPGKKSPLPAAQVTPLTGLGKQAFSAVQVIRAGKAVTNLVTILVRDRNVVVSVSLQAQASGQGFGPASVATVQAGALAVGRVVAAKAAAEPVVHG